MSEQRLERADDLDRDVLERLAHRRQADREDLRDLGVVEADDRDVATGAKPRIHNVCSTPIARVSEAQTNAVGGDSSSSTAAASAPLCDGVLDPRGETGGGMAGIAHRAQPAGATVLADG